MKHQPPTRMSLLTTQLCLRLALAFLTPIFTRTTTLYESGLSLFIMVIFTGIAQLFGCSIDFDAAKRSAIAFAGSFVVNHIADFAVLGPWTRLIAAYAMSWDAIWFLFPSVAANYWVSLLIPRCDSMLTLSRHMSHVSDRAIFSTHS